MSQTPPDDSQQRPDFAPEPTHSYGQDTTPAPSQDTSYPQQNAYGQPGPYAQQNPYGQPDPYAQQNPYGQPDPYAQQNPYGQPDPYAQQNQYGQNPYAQNPYGQQYGQGGEPTLDQPHYGIGFIPALKRFVAKYARFDGRASRSEYWWCQLGLGIIFSVLLVLGLIAAAALGEPGALDTGEGFGPLAILIFVITGLAYLAVIVPSISLLARRLHDANMSGLLILIAIVPYVGPLALTVLAILPSNPAGARFDRNPNAWSTPGPGY